MGLFAKNLYLLPIPIHPSLTVTHGYRGYDIRYAMLRNSEAHMTHTDSYDGTKMVLTDSDVEDSSDEECVSMDTSTKNNKSK